VAMINKNRDRGKATFANINLLGKCNADCFFCLGKDLLTELHGKDQLETHYSEWLNFGKFVNMCSKEGIKNLYLTGQTADGLQYKYLGEIVSYLQSIGFNVGVRTNGFLAEDKMDIINTMNAGIGYSIHSLDDCTNYKIMGSYIKPNWDKVIPASGKNVRVSVVLCEYNVNEFFDIIKYISTFENVRYIQVRRISTDTRFEELQQHIKVYEDFYKELDTAYPSYGNFYSAQQHEIFGKEVNFWRTVETSINSFNYFTDGTISDEYFIVEGYLKNAVNR
jgi:molybdenum cofactor biosynthesis enzyme MoaA